MQYLRIEKRITQNINISAPASTPSKYSMHFDHSCTLIIIFKAPDRNLFRVESKKVKESVEIDWKNHCVNKRASVNKELLL